MECMEVWLKGEMYKIDDEVYWLKREVTKKDR